MKRFLVALVLMTWGGAAFADKVARSGADELRLFASACVHGETLGRLKPEYRDKFNKMQATVSGKTVFGCYIEVAEDDVYWILVEGGEGYAIPRGAFTDEPGT